MKIWCLVFGLAVAACSGGSGGTHDGSVEDDAPSIDAPTVDAYACPVVGTAPTCGATTAPTTPAPNGGTVCNPLSQAGCTAGEKCTWIVDQITPTKIGHIGCAPTGTQPIGCGCTIGAAGATGYDDCAGGAACVSGTCKSICDNQGGAPTCGAHGVCTNYQNLFDTGGNTVAGVCDTRCDPLTQCGESPKPVACGSTDPAMPNRGCYGYDKFSCSTALPQTLTLTDRMTPAGSYLNACAPGFMPLLYSETPGTMQATCNGLCAVLETDNTAAHLNNGKGDPAAWGKLPLVGGLAQGNATCDVGKKGSEATSTCRFLWAYILDSNGDVPPAFVPYQDTLGVCFGRTHYRYDGNMDGTVTTADPTTPDCATLPPRSAATPGLYDDAADFFCQKLSNSMFAGSAIPSAGELDPSRLEPMPLVRHALR